MSRLLMLEDEQEIGETLFDILKREGYQVDWAQTGVEAVELALKNDYDLMILDLMLKQGHISNGMEVARMVKPHKKIPYMLLTSRSDPFDIMLALDSGAEDYITKPYDLSVLLARIRVILRRNANQTIKETTVLSYNGISLNLTNHEVTVDGKNISLSNQLFKMLRFMIENKKCIVTKDMLYKNIWGYEPAEVMDTNTLEVNIKRLRQQIGQKRIKTVRGKGYILE